MSKKPILPCEGEVIKEINISPADRDLKALRLKIDELDEIICDAYCKRLEIVEAVADLKKENNIAINQADREDEILSKLLLATPQQASLKSLYSHIFLRSKINQLIKNNYGKVLEFDAKISSSKANTKTPKVACQGISGAFSEQAALKLFNGAKVVFLDTFRGVFDAVRDGIADFGVVPIENSTAGGVNEVYSLLQEFPLFINASTVLEIKHCLLAKPTSTLEEIKSLLSHPQALSQCSNIIFEKGFSTNNALNTAIACEQVKNSADTSLAAIAGEWCGKLYGLKVLAYNIQNISNNSTRFVCISKALPDESDANTVGFIVELDDKPNSLLKLLELFSACNTEISRLESRSIPEKPFKVRFYLDAKGKLTDENIKTLVACLNHYEPCQSVKLLGEWRNDK